MFNCIQMKRWEFKKLLRQQSAGEQHGENMKDKIKNRQDNNGSDTAADVISEGDLCETDYYFQGGIHILL